MGGSAGDQTFTDAPGAGTPLARPEPYLVVALECDRPASGASRHALRGVDEVTIGRGDDRGATREGKRLAITVPDGWMSGAHARLTRAAGGWRVEDLGSRNGTRVGGKAVAHLVLADGDVVEAGHTMMIFREALHGPPGAPLDFDSRAAHEAPGLATLLPALAAEIAALVRIAKSTMPMLLRGETGTGKEVIARAVHALSGRGGPFVAVNCGAIPASLVEGQLFGHARGAFSGAVRDEPGFVRASHGGTLFLDEIADLPAASQAALLRVLQEGEVVPLGTTRPTPVDLRVVAATHQPLEQLVARGAFRADLHARLDGFTFALPPLRERREDTGLMVADLLASASSRPTFTMEAGRALLRYAWPMNVRELKHALSRAVVLAGDAPVDVAHLPPAVGAALGDTLSAHAAAAPPDDDDARLRAQLESLLAEHRGNVADVARALGKARMQVHRWMKRLAIDPKRYRP